MTSKWLTPALAALALAGCTQDPTRIPCGTAINMPTTGRYVIEVSLEEGDSCVWPIYFPWKVGPEGDPVELVLLTDVRYSAEVAGEEFGANFVDGTMDGRPQREPGWIGTAPLATGEHALRVTARRDAEIRIELRSQGELLRRDQITEAASLEWITGVPEVWELGVGGISRMMATLSEDGHGGRLLANWLDGFETSAHSSRPQIKALADELRATYGALPQQWDLDSLPFALTVIENRLDLRTDTSCGELRFAYQTTQPGYESLRMVFRFSQPPSGGDWTPAGTLTCIATAQAWAELSRPNANPANASNGFLNLADSLIDRNTFIGVRTHEAVGATDTEFRESRLVTNPDAATRPQLPRVLGNVPLIQTVDVPRLNQAGEARDRFLAFVAENAAALDARTATIPEEFLALSLRSQQDAYVPLDLSGVPAPTLSSFPDLRKNIEVTGCAGCHLAGDNFTLRPLGGTPAFMSAEMIARLAHLKALSQGEPQPFRYGPLQAGGINHLP